MNPLNHLKQQWKTLWPGRAVATRRLLLIALVLFPLTWIVDALLVGTWDILEDRNAEAFRHLTEAGIVFVATTCVVFLISLVPTFRRFSDWLLSPRIVRRELIVLAWILTGIALFYGEEDWRGRRGWTRYSESLKAEGNELDFKAYIPKPIPDADNFAANPEVQSWFVLTTNSDGWHSASNRWETDVFGHAQSTISNTDLLPLHFTDLVGWQMALAAAQTNQTDFNGKFVSGKLDLASRAQAAPAVLEALKPIDSRLAALHAASQRPDSVYPVVYLQDDPWGILLPHLANIKSASQRLDLRACAELAAGQSDRALQDIQLILRLCDSLKSEPFLISYLVRVAVFQIAVHPVWEGLAEHRWSDAQLRELQTSLSRYDFIGDMKRPFDAERSAGILTADLLASGKFHLNDLAGGPTDVDSKAANVFGRVVPHGWYEMEKLNYTRLYDLQLDGAFDVHQKRVFPDRMTSNSNALEQAFAGREPISTICTRHQLLAAMMLPSLVKIPMKGGFAQAAADQSTLACALERYRLAHGHFPDKLEALTPDFISSLPHDVISGDAYKYRRGENGSSPFVLYSVGWNEKDDDGTTILKGKSMNLTEGDWVWEYPAK